METFEVNFSKYYEYKFNFYVLFHIFGLPIHTLLSSVIHSVTVAMWRKQRVGEEDKGRCAGFVAIVTIRWSFASSSSKEMKILKPKMNT